MSGSALLLRLFTSEFFSVALAVQYLARHPHHIGIQHYLTGRLREFPTADVEFYWPQLLHLMISQPSEANAIETFILERCEEYAHVTLLTFWHLSAALSDLSHNPRAPSFAICQRVLSRCTALIFGDVPPPSDPYSALRPTSALALPERRINPLVRPALIGLGAVLASAGLPPLARTIGPVAVAQGRAPVIQSLEELEEDGEEDEDGEDLGRPFARGQTAPTTPPLASSNSRQTPSISFAPAPRSPRGPSHSVSSLPHPHPAPPHTLRKTPSSLSSTSSSFSSTPNLLSSVSASASSTPADPRRRSLHHAPSPSHPDALLGSYDAPSKRQLLRGHFSRNETRFLLALEDIAHRLVVIPKVARVSALRAELMSLNANLPTEVCVPMWCSEEAPPELPPGLARPRSKNSYHRVVRISPGDAVCLNSADRAPYVIQVEILQDDLDLSPDERANRDTLRRIVSHEYEKKRRRAEAEAEASTPAAATDEIDNPFRSIHDGPASGPLPPRKLSAGGESEGDAGGKEKDATPDDDEMDLVEQLYGSNLSLRDSTPDLDDLVPLPRPQNRRLDAAAWSRRDTAAPASTPVPPHAGLSVTVPSPERRSPRRSITLDEYAERMRTAAIMLAQLDATAGASDSAQGYVAAGLGGAKNAALRYLPSRPWGGAAASETPSPGADGHVSKVQQLDAAAIRSRIMAEMLALEEERMERMREDGAGWVEGGAVGRTKEDEGIVRRAVNKDDPSAAVFRESWAAKKARIRAASPYGHLRNWDLRSVIVKTGADLRQEQLATQLIQEFKRIFEEEKCPCWLRYFRILVTSENGGLVETITDAVSIHSIKKEAYARRLAEPGFQFLSLQDHFISTYGEPDSSRYLRARRNFMRSLAGYSVVTYLLQIKDRHNGNLLLDRDGHLLHIDFGFMLSNSPGSVGFEAAPFKLSYEHIEILGGLDSEGWHEYKALVKQGFRAARKHADRICTIVELMQKDSRLPCFALGEMTSRMLRDRFALNLTETALDEHVERLIWSSAQSIWTRLYDQFQYHSQGVL